MDAKTDLDTLGDRHLERVYGLFEGKAKTFRWRLFGLIVLALAFFTLIAFPYITLQEEAVRIDEEHRGLADEIAAAEADRGHLATAEGHLGDLRQKAGVEQRRMTDFTWWQALEGGAVEQGRKVKHLKESFRDDPELAAWAAGEVLRPEPSDWFFHSHPNLRDGARDPCFWLDGVRWQRCRADAEIAAFHERATRDLRRASLSDEKVSVVVEIASLEDDLNPLVGSVRAWLSGTEPAWRRDMQQQASLRGEMGLFWRGYGEALGMYASRLKAKDAERAAAIEGAASTQEILEARAAEVALQLKRIRSLDRFETPLGPLPVGLGQLVLAFPVILGLGFAITAATLAEAVRLRQVYHRLARQKDPRGAVLDDAQVALVAPLWLEPAEALPVRMARLLVLAVPALVFVATLMLAVQNRLLGVNFPSDAGLGRIVYGALYVLAAGLFVAGSLIVWRALRRYRIEPATVARPLADQPHVAA